MLAVDTETNGEDIRDGRGFCMGVSVAARVNGTLHAGYFPFRHITGGNLPQEVREALTSLLTCGVPMVFHNAKFDIVSLSTLGIDITCEFYDTMLMAHLINENRPFSYSLNATAAWYLGKEDENQKDAAEDMKKFIKQFGWGAIPVPMIEAYAIQDAVLTLKLASKLWPLFMDENLGPYWKQKQDFVRVIIAMEKLGVRINQTLCIEEIIRGEARMAEICVELGGTPTGKYLEELLLVRLGLPVMKRSEKTNKPSFDKFAMELYEFELAYIDSNIAQLILEYRGYQKTVSSNYRAYSELVSPDGRLRCNYKLHGTKTGRMSCAEPNLQQIPRVSNKPWNGKLKEAFTAEDGYTLWEADYAQLELRLSTAYANVEILKQVFKENRDIFTEMAAMLEMVRQDCKTFVYSTQYGAGVRRIKTALGVTESKARQIRENYFATYPGFRYISEKVGAVARQHRKIKLWTGRYRHFMDPEKEAHKAFNSLIQGGAADIVERVMVRLYNEVVVPSNDECRMLLQVHDSVVFEFKIGTEDKYKALVHAIMEDVDALSGTEESFDVTFKVEIKAWGGD